MKLFYVTLNNHEEAKSISRVLLEKKLALCTNWFPINCAYLWQGETKMGDEVVLIIKTTENSRRAIEETIQGQIQYTNFIAELAVHSINQNFLTWMQNELGVKE